MSEFDPDIKTHRELVEKTVDFLEEMNQYSIDTPALAGKIAEKNGVNLKENTVYSLLNDGTRRENNWIVENTKIVIERERGGTSGSPTKYWRLEE